MSVSYTHLDVYKRQGIYNVVGRYGVEWCRAMAFGCMAVLPVILIFVFMQKYIVQGLTAGAVKG